MLREKRFSNIIEYLKVNNTAKVDQLAKLNQVSLDTVRRDLETLEGYGTLKRVRGGAVLKNDDMERQPYDMRTMLRGKEKLQLAELVGQVVKEGQTIAIGSGSTTVEIARYLAVNYDSLTVITNDIDIVHLLTGKENFNLIVAGGFYDAKENATYGVQCEEEIGHYNADVGILAINSISLDKGLSDFRMNQIDAFRKIIDISDEVIVGVDSSKFGKTACVTLCGLKDINVILSDDKLSAEQKKDYEKRGVKVIVPDKNI